MLIHIYIMRSTYNLPYEIPTFIEYVSLEYNIERSKYYFPQIIVASVKSQILNSKNY